MQKKAFVVPCLILLALLLTVESNAGVKAGWGKTRGREVALEMRVSEAVPSLIIVRLHMATELQIVGITPEPKKRDDSGRGLKLLFDDLKPGINRITITADKRIRKQDISGNIMYKDPDTGTMEKSSIKW